MKLPILCFIFGGLEGLIRGETFLEPDQYIKYATEITQELTEGQAKPDLIMTDKSGIDDKQSAAYQNNGQSRGFSEDSLSARGIYTTANRYLMRSLQTSINSLLGLDKFYQIINPDAAEEEEELPQNFALQKTAALRGSHHVKKHVHAELTYFTVLLILKFVGVLVTKVKFAIGIMMIKLFVGKLILLYLYTKHHKHHPGPLVKAYHTTTNEFHSHRRREHEIHPHEHEISPYGHEFHPYTHESHPYGHEIHPHGQESHPYGQESHPYGQEIHPQDYLERDRMGLPFFQGL